MQDSLVIKQTRHWIETVVVDLNLCPFAKRELVAERVRIEVSTARNAEQLLTDLKEELETLLANEAVETTVLVHPYVLDDFIEYNQFLDIADQLLIDAELEGTFQVASFHPAYQFADTDINDAENYSNRSPYPMLHLLREDSVERAVNEYPDPDNIPERNINLLQRKGVDEMRRMLQSCLDIE